MNLYANNKKQSLAEHLFAVGSLAARIIQSHYSPKDAKERDDIVRLAYLSGCLHDVGKIDTTFQRFLDTGNSEYDSLLGQQIIKSACLS